MNQRGFDNQPAEYLTAAAAAKMLGVKRATVYAYASRGWLGLATKGPGSRALYPRSAVERLRLRARARSGHTAVAAGALWWGEPVLDTAVSSMTPQGPEYRGRNAVELARQGMTFEGCAEWLWASKSLSPWPPALKAPRWVRLPAPGPGATLSRLLTLVSAVALFDDTRFGASGEAELHRARGLIRLMAQRAGPWAERASAEYGSISATLGVSLRGSVLSREELGAVDMALVLCADHELNASTFAARIAASAGCDLYASVCAGLATLSGARHGGACDRVEAMLSRVETPRALVRASRASSRLAVETTERSGFGSGAGSPRGRGASGPGPDPVERPGFEPVSYPGGDPRGPPLVEVALKVAKVRSRMKAVEAMVKTVARLTGESPSVDFGLVAVARALGFGPGSAGAMFAVARMAGWVAHVLEQRQSGAAIRPRARYAAENRD